MWQNSTVFGSTYELQQPEYAYEAKLAQKLVEMKVFKQTIGIELFMSPPDEVVGDPSASDSIQYVVDQYQAEKDDGPDEEMLPEPPIVSPNDASRAIQRLVRYEHQHNDVDVELIEQLERYQHPILTRQLEKTVQGRSN